jgi:hypothetical protein
MITFKKTFDYYTTDNELGNYIALMADVVIGDVDPQIEFDVESDDQHRYIIFNFLDKVLH